MPTAPYFSSPPLRQSVPTGVILTALRVLPCGGQDSSARAQTSGSRQHRRCHPGNTAELACRSELEASSRHRLQTQPLETATSSRRYKAPTSAIAERRASPYLYTRRGRVRIRATRRTPSAVHQPTAVPALAQRDGRGRVSETNGPPPSAATACRNAGGRRIPTH